MQNTRIIVTAAIVIGIGALLIPGMNLAPAAFAGHHHHHHHHHGVSSSISITQLIRQSNSCTNCANGNGGGPGSHSVTQTNTATNTATVN
ncbi:MAG: hypothetical protein M3P08_06795 [Thermoproteota archaeon]|nr:hypothetical protein [Thermoproteota archaeon]